MIQDIEPYIFYNQYHPRDIKENDVLLSYHKGEVGLANGESLVRYNPSSPLNNPYYAFEVDDTAFYIVENDEMPINTIYQPLSFLREVNPRVVGFAGITGYQLWMWKRNNQFCGHCGSKLEPSIEERAFVCPNCQSIIYPRIQPAVIVAVHHGDQLLLTKYREGYSKYALIAGFCEIGETIEQTVKREVYEEVGLQVKNIKYYGSQPWSFSDTLLLGFNCEVDGDDTVHLDNHELKLGKWFTKEEIIDETDSASLTRQMINDFRNGKL